MRLLETLKSWWHNIFNKTEVLQALNLNDADLSYNCLLDYTQIWKRLYSGTEFADIKDPKIAATVCHEASRLVVSEMEVTVGESPRAKYINNLLQTQIINRAGEITEYACAMGGLILKPRFDGEKIITDVMTQDLFFPTQYDATGVQGGIFVEQKRKGKYFFTRLENYIYKGHGTYGVENKAYKSENGNDLGKQVTLDCVSEWAGIEPTVTLKGAPCPVFAYYKMPGANYIEPNNPMGVSLFGKAVDSIRAAVTAYNALDWEVEGGELKLYRDISTYTDFDTDGNIRTPEKRQKEYAFNGAVGENGAELFHTHSPSLRVNDQITALNRHLNQIEAQTGFTQGTFSIDAKTGMATATQVVSDNQKTYSTIHDIQTKSFETAIRQLIAIYDFYATVYGLAPKGEIDPAFSWDDSIVSSPDDKRARMQLLLTQGKFPLWMYLRDYEGYSEDDAKAIQAETEKAAPDINFSGGGTDADA